MQDELGVYAHALDAMEITGSHARARTDHALDEATNRTARTETGTHGKHLRPNSRGETGKERAHEGAAGVVDRARRRGDGDEEDARPRQKTSPNRSDRGTPARFLAAGGTHTDEEEDLVDGKTNRGETQAN